MKFQKVCWLMALLVVLSACNRNTITPTVELTLAPSSSEVTNGETVTLTATIDEGTEDVALVEFAVKDGDVISSDDGADGSYTAVSAALDEATTFVATAKDENGTTLGESNEATVTVSAAPLQANAEDKQVTTLENVQVVGGGTPTGLAVTTEALVAENGEAEIVEGSEENGVATVEDDGTFTFTPTADFSGEASFSYRVVDGANSDEATVTVTVTALPDNTTIASTLAEINGAPEAETILWAGEITCDSDNDPSGEANCVLLKANQQLLGGGEVAGVVVNNPNAKLVIDLPDGSVTGSITGIKLASGVTVEGLEISGVADEFYTAISGSVADFDTNPAPDVITPSSVTLRDVTIIGPTSNAPLTMRLNGAPLGSYYDLTIDGLEVTGIDRAIGLTAFNTLTFTNSVVAMNITSNTRGLIINAEGESTAVIDNVDISSEVASETFTPMFIVNGSGGGVLGVTVKNSDITFPGATSEQLSGARSFGFDYENSEAPPRGGRIEINTPESVNNTSEANGAVTYEAESPNTAADKITGYIQGNKPLVFIER